jgi:hypothetical protein
VDNACEDQWLSGLVDILYSRVLKNNEVHVIDQLNVRCTGLIGFLTCRWCRCFWIQIKYKDEHLLFQIDKNTWSMYTTLSQFT